jgi:membrane protease YdiL (CAAX protease family)
VLVVALLTKESSSPPEQVLPLYVVVVGMSLLFGGLLVYRKMIRRIGIRGGLVRSDLFGLPDVLVTGALVVLLLLTVAMNLVVPSVPKPPEIPSTPEATTGLQIIYKTLVLALPMAVIFALLIARGISLPLLFGLKRVGLVRAVGVAAGLLLLLLPVIALVAILTNWILGGQSEPQELVKTYQQAAKGGNPGIIWQVIVGAVVIAPITEEILFRGYFYPVLKRVAGAVPAAFGISLLFAAIHNTASGFPVLTVLALALTLAYEWSGSIAVSIFMHAWFNATTLFVMWWATRHGLMP